MVNKILCEIVPVKEVPGLLPNKKKLRKPAVMELSKRNILYAMRYAKVYAIKGEDKILISSSAKLDELFKYVEEEIPKYKSISKDEMPEPVKVETPYIEPKVEKKYIEESVEDKKEIEEIDNEETFNEDIEEPKKEDKKPSFDKDRFVKSPNSSKKPPLKKENDKK